MAEGRLEVVLLKYVKETMLGNVALQDELEEPQIE